MVEKAERGTGLHLEMAADDLQSLGPLILAVHEHSHLVDFRARLFNLRRHLGALPDHNGTQAVAWLAKNLQIAQQFLLGLKVNRTAISDVFDDLCDLF